VSCERLTAGPGLTLIHEFVGGDAAAPQEGDDGPGELPAGRRGIGSGRARRTLRAGPREPGASATAVGPPSPAPGIAVDPPALPSGPIAVDDAPPPCTMGGGS
jgi:hypothetical protein